MHRTYQQFAPTQRVGLLFVTGQQSKPTQLHASVVTPHIVVNPGNAAVEDTLEHLMLSDHVFDESARLGSERLDPSQMFANRKHGVLDMLALMYVPLEKTSYNGDPTRNVFSVLLSSVVLSSVVLSSVILSSVILSSLSMSSAVLSCVVVMSSVNIFTE